MKKIVYIILFVLPVFAFSQQLVFKYDESGNQIERSVNTSGRVAPEEPKATEVIEEQDTLSNDFVVYPNPTAGPITLRWAEEHQGKVASITLSDMAGHKEEIEFKSNITEIEIDLTIKPQGVYIVNFHLINGKRIDKKIIKQN